MSTFFSLIIFNYMRRLCKRIQTKRFSKLLRHIKAFIQTLRLECYHLKFSMQTWNSDLNNKRDVNIEYILNGSTCHIHVHLHILTHTSTYMYMYDTVHTLIFMCFLFMCVVVLVYGACLLVVAFVVFFCTGTELPCCTKTITINTVAWQ